MDAANNVGKIKIRNMADLMAEPANKLVATAPTTPPTPSIITIDIDDEDANENKTNCIPSITKAALSTTTKQSVVACSTIKKSEKKNRNSEAIIGQKRIDKFFKSASKNYSIEPMKQLLEPLTNIEGSIRKRNNIYNATNRTPRKQILKKNTGRKRLFSPSDSDSVISIKTCDSSVFEQKTQNNKKGKKLKSDCKHLRRSAQNIPETATVVDLTLEIDESVIEEKPKITNKSVTPESDRQKTKKGAKNNTILTLPTVIEIPHSPTKEESKLESQQQYVISVKNGKVKQVPPYKIVEGTTFAVDAFDYGDIPNITHYFLTHYHADHYVGLTGKFKNIIYATKTTIRLIRAFMPSVDKKFLHELEMNEPLIVNNVEVTAIDANHCPGAVMLVFKLENGKCILHTGDFRACSNMESEPIFWNNDISDMYLDTTYLSDKYSFCHQTESIDKAIDLIEKFKEKNPGKRILYVCGTYLVGKEHFWTALAKYFDWKVWAESQRYKSLKVLENPQIDDRLCNDIKEAQLHIIPLMKLRYDNLLDYFLKLETNHDVLFALRPSGWEKNSRPQYRGAINIVGIEYSEHSSHTELERFVKFLKPDRVISTVPVAGNPFITGRVPLKWYKYKGYAKMLRNVQLSITAFTKKQLPITCPKTPSPTVSEKASQFVLSPMKKRSNDNDENVNRENANKTIKFGDDQISIEQQKSTKHKTTSSTTTTTPEVPGTHNNIHQLDAKNDKCQRWVNSFTNCLTMTPPEVQDTNKHMHQLDARNDGSRRWVNSLSKHETMTPPDTNNHILISDNEDDWMS